MNYINRVDKRIKNYFDILCNNKYPSFINKYINTVEMQRLRYIGQFCGHDYHSIDIIKPKYWYSRLDHSIACALITWNITKDKSQTLSALFHDLGTPAFSHCIDYLLEDYINQKSSERDVGDILSNSNKIRELLKQDNIDISLVNDVTKYTIFENEKPKLCVDRLEGIFHTGLIWGKFWTLKDIKFIYNNLVVCTNEENELEIGIKGIKHAERFYNGAYEYSILLQTNENNLMVKLLSDIIRMSIEYKLFDFDDLYKLKEIEIIDLVKNGNTKILNEMWDTYSSISSIKRSNKRVLNKYCVSINSKKRYVSPLCVYKNKTYRLIDISMNSKKLLNKYLLYADTSYAYIDTIFNI